MHSSWLRPPRFTLIRGEFQRPSARLLLFGVAVSVLVLLGNATPASAESVYWTNSLGGLYSGPSNWSPNGVPVASDSVSFTNTGTYALTVDVAATNAAAFFNQGSVTQAISAGVWLLTNEWRVGEARGSTSRETFVSGLLGGANVSEPAA